MLESVQLSSKNVPKSFKIGLKWCQNRSKMVQNEPWGALWAPRGVQGRTGCPKGAQHDPQMRPRSPQMTPKDPQMRPNGLESPKVSPNDLK